MRMRMLSHSPTSHASDRRNISSNTMRRSQPVHDAAIAYASPVASESQRTGL